MRNKIFNNIYQIQNLKEKANEKRNLIKNSNDYTQSYKDSLIKQINDDLLLELSNISKELEADITTFESERKANSNSKFSVFDDKFLTVVKTIELCGDKLPETAKSEILETFKYNTEALNTIKAIAEQKGIADFSIAIQENIKEVKQASLSDLPDKIYYDCINPNITGEITPEYMTRRFDNFDTVYSCGGVANE